MRKRNKLESILPEAWLIGLAAEAALCVPRCRKIRSVARKEGRCPKISGAQGEAGWEQLQKRNEKRTDVQPDKMAEQRKIL